MEFAIKETEDDMHETTTDIHKSENDTLIMEADIFQNWS